jgi:hypothetical protein
MFNLFKKATSVSTAGNALWLNILDGNMAPELAMATLEGKSSNSAKVFDEAVYFLCFATDFAIHTAMKAEPPNESAVREVFLDRVRTFAIDHCCGRPPIGHWIDESNIWEVRSQPLDTGNAVQNLSTRFDLYTAAMDRSASRSLPVVGILAGLCDTRDVDFIVLATSFFVDSVKHTQDFLRSFRIQSSDA